MIAPHARPERLLMRNRKRFPIIGVALIAGLTVTMAGIFPFRQMIAQQRQVDQTQAHLDALVEGNLLLEGEIAGLESSAGVERLAREQYGFVRPGETAYSLEQIEVPTVAALSKEDARQFDERSLLERAWDFLTGRDLVPDE